jgi:hypothetical protein
MIRVKIMLNLNNNRNQPHIEGRKASDTEFGAEFEQSKKRQEKSGKRKKK